MIRIVTLVENTSCNKACGSKHGLSFYIETKSHKILFDVGPNDLYYKNAKKLGINIEDVDMMILSHGHVDHGGGLEHFLKINKKAKVYARLEAFNEHYTMFLGLNIKIGIDCVIDNERFVITDNKLKIDDEIELFSGVTGRKLFSYMNGTLFVKKNGQIERDRFEHEQYLIVSDENTKILLTGCSHNGVANIVEKYDELYKDAPLVAVIGGFHLYDPVKRKYESKDRILDITNWLLGRKEKYYTCHCTGRKAFEIMNGVMGTQLTYVSTGSKLEF